MPCIFLYMCVFCVIPRFLHYMTHKIINRIYKNSDRNYKLSKALCKDRRAYDT